MSIKISNLEVIERIVKKRVDDMGSRFEGAVDTQRKAIETRTNSGIDVNGQQFAPYSKKHKWNWRDERRVNGYQTAYVDLKFSGDMFKAFKTIVKKDGFKFLATIFFDDRKQAQKAKGHHTGQLGNVKFQPRKFFGLSQSQREAIVSKIRNAR